LFNKQSEWKTNFIMPGKVWSYVKRQGKKFGVNNKSKEVVVSIPTESEIQETKTVENFDLTKGNRTFEQFLLEESTTIDTQCENFIWKLYLKINELELQWEINKNIKSKITHNLKALFYVTLNSVKQAHDMKIKKSDGIKQYFKDSEYIYNKIPNISKNLELRYRDNSTRAIFFNKLAEGQIAGTLVKALELAEINQNKIKILEQKLELNYTPKINKNYNQNILFNWNRKIDIKTILDWSKQIYSLSWLTETYNKTIKNKLEINKLAPILRKGSLRQKLLADRLAWTNKNTDILPDNKYFNSNIKNAITTDTFDYQLNNLRDKSKNPYILIQYLNKTGQSKFLLYSDLYIDANPISNWHSRLLSKATSKLVQKGISEQNIIWLTGGYITMNNKKITLQDNSPTFTNYTTSSKYTIKKNIIINKITELLDIAHRKEEITINKDKSRMTNWFKLDVNQLKSFDGHIKLGYITNKQVKWQLLKNIQNYKSPEWDYDCHQFIHNFYKKGRSNWENKDNRKEKEHGELIQLENRDKIKKWDIILCMVTDSDGKSKTNHSAIYLWQWLYLYKTWPKGKIIITNTRQMMKLYPHDYVSIYKPITNLEKIKPSIYKSLKKNALDKKQFIKKDKIENINIDETIKRKNIQNLDWIKINNKQAKQADILSLLWGQDRLKEMFWENLQIQIENPDNSGNMYINIFNKNFPEFELSILVVGNQQNINTIQIKDLEINPNKQQKWLWKKRLTNMLDNANKLWIETVELFAGKSLKSDKMNWYYSRFRIGLPLKNSESNRKNLWEMYNLLTTNKMSFFINKEGKLANNNALFTRHDYIDWKIEGYTQIKFDHANTETKIFADNKNYKMKEIYNKLDKILKKYTAQNNYKDFIDEPFWQTEIGKYIWFEYGFGYDCTVKTKEMTAKLNKHIKKTKLKTNRSLHQNIDKLTISNIKLEHNTILALLWGESMLKQAFWDKININIPAFSSEWSKLNIKINLSKPETQKLEGKLDLILKGTPNQITTMEIQLVWLEKNKQRQWLWSKLIKEIVTYAQTIWIKKIQIFAWRVMIEQNINGYYTRFQKGFPLNNSPKNKQSLATMQFMLNKNKMNFWIDKEGKIATTKVLRDRREQNNQKTSKHKKVVINNKRTTLIKDLDWKEYKINEIFTNINQLLKKYMQKNDYSEFVNEPFWQTQIGKYIWIEYWFGYDCIISPQKVNSLLDTH